MASFTPGTGATVTATTLENQLFTLISLIQSIEFDPAKNDKTVNAISGTTDTDTNLLNGSAQIYAQMLRDSSTGEINISYPNPYTGVIYTEGTGGDSKNTSGLITEALVERALLLIAAEREKKRVEAVFALRLTTPTWALLDVPLNSPVPHNAIFRFNFNILTTTTFTGSGETRSAVEYL